MRQRHVIGSESESTDRHAKEMTGCDVFADFLLRAKAIYCKQRFGSGDNTRLDRRLGRFRKGRVPAS